MTAKILDMGCGRKKKPGAIGMDVNPDADADVVHDLNRFPYPFPDSTFDEINADNVLEHLDDVIKVMDEIHRICKQGALVVVKVPYFRARWAFVDPTHKHFFTVESFAYFDPSCVQNRLYNYSRSKFSIERLAFNDNIGAGLFKAILRRVANAWPLRYERFLSVLFPLDELTFKLRVVK